MKNLIEFARIVKKVNLKTTDFLATDSQKKTKADVFYEKILAGDFKTDQEASLFFYNSDTNHSNYKNLKRSLRRKLTNTLFFIESKKTHSDYERAYLYCSKNMFAAKILLFLQAQNAGINLCHKVFAKAVEFDLTEYILDSCRYLRIHYGTRVGDSDKFNLYNKTSKKYLKVWIAENLAEEYYATLTLPNIQKKTNDEETKAKAVQFSEELLPYLEEYESPFLHFLGNYIHVISLMYVNDYNNVIDVCEKAIRFFEAKPYMYKTPLRVFLHHQLICYTQLKAYEKGKEVAIKSMGLVRAGTGNWFINKELHLILAFHSAEYDETKVILEEAIKQYKFKSLSTSMRERWIIYEAYVRFLEHIGKIDQPEEGGRNYRMGKFLNSVPTFSKDKKGLNIPILVIQILFLIVTKNYDQTIDRFEAIEKYCSRYILKNESFRSNCFIKMLLQIPNCDFHKAGVERKTKSYLTQLKSVPLEVANQGFEIEIIPYEDLWEFLMESLETKFHKSRRRRIS